MKDENTIIIATKNKGKAKEFEELFHEKGYQIKTLHDFPEVEDVEETGETFEENALLKAETISKQFNKLVLADDSGLIVDALHGAPGVYSARYAGEEKSDSKNNAKLLSELSDVDSNDRTARFHCTLAVARPGKESLVVNGEVHGKISEVPKGDNGFGYDPLFYLPEKGKMMAELKQEEKNKISHRYQALLELDKKFDEWIK